MYKDISVDALMPLEMAERAETIGVRKAELSFLKLFALSVLAGAFVALGAMFATTTAAGSSALPYGVARMLIGMTFCIGLILIVVGGAELFTGNILIVMAWALVRWVQPYLCFLASSIPLATGVSGQPP
jgi:formate transporter